MRNLERQKPSKQFLSVSFNFNQDYHAIWCNWPYMQLLLYSIFSDLQTLFFITHK